MLTIIIQIVVVLVLTVTIISVLMYSYLRIVEKEIIADCLKIARLYNINPEDYMTIEELVMQLELAIDKDWDTTITDMED